MATEPFEDILKTLASIPAKDFKAAFISWYGESMHAGWDGMSDISVHVFEDMFMRDFALSFMHGLPLEGFITFGGKDHDLKNME